MRSLRAASGKSASEPGARRPALAGRRLGPAAPCSPPAPRAPPGIARWASSGVGSAGAWDVHRRFAPAPDRCIIEILEELRVGAQQQPRIAGPQRAFVGLHRTVEGEELRVLVEGLGEDAVPLGIARAADALRFAGGVGLDHGDLAVGGARMRRAAPSPSARNSAASRCRSVCMRR